MGKILAIDDEPLMHSVYSRALRNHELLHAIDGHQGLILYTNHQDIETVITDRDYKTPSYSGADFIEDAIGIRYCPMLMITGDNLLRHCQDIREAGGVGMLAKPFQNLPEIVQGLVDADDQILNFYLDIYFPQNLKQK